MADPSQFPPGYLEEDRSRPAYIGIIFATSLSFVVVLVRLYSRKFLVRDVGWDDYFIVMAQVSLLVHTVVPLPLDSTPANTVLCPP